MRVPTPHRGVSSIVANKTSVVSRSNNMITPPLQYAHTACHPLMGHLIRQVKQTGPRAQISASPDIESGPQVQISASPDAESDPRMQSPPHPMPSLALERFLHLARPRVRSSGDFSASPELDLGHLLHRESRERSLRRVWHTSRDGTTKYLRKTFALPERGSDLDK
jgi:hypothetical protein